MALVEQDVRERHADRARHIGAQSVGVARFDRAEVDCDNRHLRARSAQDERGCREVALDRLDRVAEEAAADLPDPERRVDDAPCGAGLEGSVHR